MPKRGCLARNVLAVIVNKLIAMNIDCSSQKDHKTDNNTSD